MKHPISFITLSFFLVCMTYAPLRAQSERNRIGVKAGLNLSSMNASDDANTEMITGFNLGVFGKMPVSSFISVQPELYLTTKGAAVTYNNMFVDGTAHFNLTYVEVPVLVVFNLTNFLNVHAGPYVSYMLNGKVTNQSNVNIFNFEDNINVDDYNRIDAGIAVGAGLDVGAISVGARYNFGFTKVGKEQSIMGTTVTVPNATNGVLNMYVSLSLN